MSERTKHCQEARGAPGLCLQHPEKQKATVDTPKSCNGALMRDMILIPYYIPMFHYKNSTIKSNMPRASSHSNPCYNKLFWGGRGELVKLKLCYTVGLSFRQLISTKKFISKIHYSEVCCMEYFSDCIFRSQNKGEIPT